MTASFNATRSGGDEPNLNEVPSTAPVCIVDLCEAREWLPAESERIARQKKQIAAPVGSIQAKDRSCRI